MTISRRSFLKSTAATAAITATGAAISKTAAKDKSGMQPGPGNKWPGRVVFNYNKNAVSDSGSVDEDVVKKMVDDCITVLTGKSEIGEAWKAIFPDSLSASSKIAIKTNILNPGKPCPHASTVQAMTGGLIQMDFGGTKFPAENITIYDGNNSNSLSSAGYEQSRFEGMHLVKDSQSKHGDGARNDQAYAKSLNDADFLINVFSPRGHFLGGKVTLGFKSHYGTYASPSQMHSGEHQILADLNCSGPVFQKTVLSMCSGLFGMDIGNGPNGSTDDFSTYGKTVDESTTNVASCTIMLSTDPVSCDMQAYKIMRLNKGQSYGTDDMPDYLKIAAGVSGNDYNIGIIDEGQMDIRKIVNGVLPEVSISKGLRKDTSGRISHLQVRHLKNQDNLFIEYALPHNLIGTQASIEIFTVKGNRIFSRRHTAGGVLNHLSWNKKGLSGRRIPNGTYIVRVTAGTVKLSRQVTVTR